MHPFSDVFALCSSIPPLLGDACSLEAQHLGRAVVVDLSARLQVLMAAVQVACAELGEIAFEIGGENAVIEQSGQRRGRCRRIHFGASSGYR